MLNDSDCVSLLYMWLQLQSAQNIIPLILIVLLQMFLSISWLLIDFYYAHWRWANGYIFHTTLPHRARFVFTFSSHLFLSICAFHSIISSKLLQWRKLFSNWISNLTLYAIRNNSHLTLFFLAFYSIHIPYSSISRPYTVLLVQHIKLDRISFQIENWIFFVHCQLLLNIDNKNIHHSRSI